jgi:hypothetical protein
MLCEIDTRDKKEKTGTSFFMLPQYAKALLVCQSDNDLPLSDQIKRLKPWAVLGVQGHHT